MEPHKAYNYAAAGLPTVTLNTATAPVLGPFVDCTCDPGGFVEGVRAALAVGRLSGEQLAVARSLTWDRVAEGLLTATGCLPAPREPALA